MADLKEIWDYLKLRNPKGAKNVIADIRNTLRRLGELPLTGRVQTQEGVRKAVTRRYGKLVFYEVGSVVSIITIQDPHRERAFHDAWFFATTPDFSRRRSGFPRSARSSLTSLLFFRDAAGGGTARPEVHPLTFA